MSKAITDATVVSETADNKNFANFGFPEIILITLAREGLVEPTPIQSLSIPPLLDGKDLIGLAQTGTGKTAAFLLPLMTQLNLTSAVRAGKPPKALILVPTRELANQISQNVQKLSADLNIRHIAIFGGARYDTQIRALRRGVDIVVATPGRLQDLMNRGAFDPKGITHFVLDEADHMLDLGFFLAIKRIAAALPKRRQTMLFSATMPPEIEALGQQFLSDPVRVKAPQAGITADKVTQRVTLMAEGEKRDKLSEILQDHTTSQALIFVRTKRRADALAKFLSVRGFAVDALHGDMRQTLRQKVLRNFRSGNLQALIATDVAARGIDIAGLSHVVNFDLTDTPEAYVHRIGRTGRAGLGGLALSFCAPNEQHKLAAIISVVGDRVELFALDGTTITDFKAATSNGQKRRQRTAPSDRQSRTERRSRNNTSSDRHPPRSKKPARKRRESAYKNKNESDKKENYFATDQLKKPLSQSKFAESSKSAINKNKIQANKKLFRKRPKFKNRPSFDDSPKSQPHKEREIDKSYFPNRKSKRRTREKLANIGAGSQNHDDTAKSKNHANKRSKQANQGSHSHKAFSDDKTRQRLAHRGSPKSGYGGDGRLKRKS